MTRKNRTGRFFAIGRSRDFIDYATMMVAVVAIAIPFWQHFVRTRIESPAVAISGQHRYVLTPEDYSDVLNALYDSSTLMAHFDREMKTSHFLFDTFVNTAEFRLFKLIIRNTHNVPVSLSDLRVDDLVIASTNRNLIVKAVQGFAKVAEGGWDTSPILHLRPYESIAVQVVVGFIAVDQDAGHGLSVAEQRAQAQIRSLRFRMRDNIGKDHASEVIPIWDHVVTE